MAIVCDPAQLAHYANGVFVPTMGALHEGHEALISRARQHAEQHAGARGTRPGVVASVFVNPTQFNETVDFNAYPRTLERDAAIAERAGADIVFAPSAEVVYPPDGSPAAATALLPAEHELPDVARLPGLEDRARPGHFAGVYAVVKRLFELTRCTAAVFGEKDWQQLQVVRALVEREGMPIEIVAHPTVRELDGIAMSSRNARLTPEQRRQAGAIPAAIAAARAQSNPADAERSAFRTLQLCGLDVEYAVVRDAETLLECTADTRHARLLIAVSLGGTRLIDNERWAID